MDSVLDISGVEDMQGRSVLGVLWMIGISLLPPRRWREFQGNCSASKKGK